MDTHYKQLIDNQHLQDKSNYLEYNPEEQVFFLFFIIIIIFFLYLEINLNYTKRLPLILFLSVIQLVRCPSLERD